eukprot:scaffold8058_cov158-Amphora_coffeaeformis.AAC.2
MDAVGYLGNITIWAFPRHGQCLVDAVQARRARSRGGFLPSLFDEQGSSSRSKRKSGGVTVSGISPQPVSNELSNERLVDDLGLPKQGPDFQFLDETIVDNMDPNDDDIEQEPQQDEGGQAQGHDEDKAREEPRSDPTSVCEKFGLEHSVGAS